MEEVLSEQPALSLSARVREAAFARGALPAEARTTQQSQACMRELTMMRSLASSRSMRWCSQSLRTPASVANIS